MRRLQGRRGSLLESTGFGSIRSVDEKFGQGLSFIRFLIRFHLCQLLRHGRRDAGEVRRFRLCRGVGGAIRSGAQGGRAAAGGVARRLPKSCPQSRGQKGECGRGQKVQLGKRCVRSVPKVRVLQSTAPRADPH